MAQVSEFYPYLWAVTKNVDTMEDFLPLIIVAVILIVNAANAKRKVSGKAADEEAEPAEDYAPDTDYAPEAEVLAEDDEVTYTAQRTAAYTARDTAPAGGGVSAAANRATVPRHGGRTHKPSAKGEGYGNKVRLKTRADARRAFIYSEIFQRKYNT